MCYCVCECVREGGCVLPPLLYSSHLPDWNLKARLLEPYCRMWSICQRTMSRGESLSVKRAMWNKLRSKSLHITTTVQPHRTQNLNLEENFYEVKNKVFPSFYVYAPPCIYRKVDYTHWVLYVKPKPTKTGRGGGRYICTSESLADRSQRN